MLTSWEIVKPNYEYGMLALGLILRQLENSYMWYIIIMGRAVCYYLYQVLCFIKQIQ